MSNDVIRMLVAALEATADCIATNKDGRGSVERAQAERSALDIAYIALSLAGRPRHDDEEPPKLVEFRLVFDGADPANDSVFVTMEIWIDNRGTEMPHMNMPLRLFRELGGHLPEKVAFYSLKERS